ncbi:MAG: hypothetical protein A2046_00695 [Bacteroidetes bacterium GWA2_30_7]|nr:MAG: hypothetical protein A2046_00695 [Bacteroidetes bacterium GWA2_30_7]
MINVFENIGFEINGIKHISGNEAILCIKQGAIIIDIREFYDINYKVFDVENALNIPKTELEKNLNLVPDDKALIIADAFGINSKLIVMQLVNNGIKNVANLIGGILDWEKDGLPVKKDLKGELNGPCLCMLKTREKLANK